MTVDQDVLNCFGNTPVVRPARAMKKGTIAILPGRGDRYLSATRFRSACGNRPH